MLDKKFIIKYEEILIEIAKQRNIRCSIAEFVRKAKRLKDKEREIKNINEEAKAIAEDNRISLEEKRTQEEGFQNTRQEFKRQINALNDALLTLQTDISKLTPYLRTNIGIDSSDVESKK